MKITIQYWFLWVLIGFSIPANSQNYRTSIVQLNVDSKGVIANFEESVTSLIIQTESQFNFENLQFYYLGNWHNLAHGHNSEKPYWSDPIIFAKEENNLLIRSINNQNVILHTVFSPPYSNNIKLYKQNNVPCIKPNSIAPILWRDGLPEPKPGRLSTQVEHCIVHHAAGSNFNTDYYNVVRNIYLLHTQTNGWDDIGYNYLIAQDGTLFIGRDPQNINTEDNIQGAHFCAKNANTMGTCLLGNYTDTIPSDTTWAILKQLLVWKLIKENLNPLDSNLHPDDTGILLPVIAGHRDGCNTECPGQKVYDQLPQLRIDVKNAIDFCTLSSIDKIDNKIIIYRKEDYLNLIMESPPSEPYKFRIISTNGIEISSGLSHSNSIYIGEIASGLYYLIFNIGMNQHNYKFNVLR